ncbi:DNA repair exonuclease [Ramlibacter sp. AN1015]|uniref:metallophosphoesterase family protein n=1 Tax=Ramlibacter sp. AN1015 TaxID=3133428 RepID=UPI0030BB54C2
MPRFVHAADIHLDSPLHGLAAYPDAPAAQLRNATREAFSRLVSRTIEEQADFLVIAGDLYDGGWRDHNTGLFFCSEMGRLRRAGIPVFVLFGNHDAESEMTRKLTLPDNVRCFSARRAETLRLDGLGVALHGQSFRDKATEDNLAARYPEPVPGMLNIGVLHTALEGHSAHARYAPCTLDELQARGYDYWALGHVHDYQRWDGPATVVFPGNLQGRHIRETGPRGAVLVHAQDGRIAVERLFVDVLRWESLAVDLTECTSMAEVAARVGAGFESLLAVDGGIPRAVRVTLEGSTPLHGELFGNAVQLRSEVLAQVATIGNERLWLEKVRLATREHARPDAGRGDALASLAQILAEAEGDAELLRQLGADLAPFVNKLPPELRTQVPLLDLVTGARLDALVREVAPDLLAHLARLE